jgi:hypothetical protein
VAHGPLAAAAGIRTTDCTTSGGLPVVGADERRLGLAVGLVRAGCSCRLVACPAGARAFKFSSSFIVSESSLGCMASVPLVLPTARPGGEANSPRRGRLRAQATCQRTPGPGPRSGAHTVTLRLGRAGSESAGIQGSKLGPGAQAGSPRAAKARLRGAAGGQATSPRSGGRRSSRAAFADSAHGAQALRHRDGGPGTGMLT